MRAELIEKDFWVCWVLKRVFALPEPPAGLIFKGGTSLSKVYRAIERFSEDVDLSFNRSDLGFGGEHDPKVAKSKKQAKEGLERLGEVCRVMVAEQFLPLLEATFDEHLGAAPSPTTWGVEFDLDDPDGQTLLFRYPTQTGNPQSVGPYVRQVVRLETGARGEHWPAEEATITPYAAEAIPKLFTDPSCPVHVLGAERTFWEKATILHACYHRAQEKPLKPRQSRHYYDVARLFDMGIGKRALADLGLLREVAAHQEVFFRSAGARFGEAVPGTLKLVPPEFRRKELEDDYRKMAEMFFGEPPSLTQIHATLAEIEQTVNASS